MQNRNHLVIMAGGIGSRFWPMSTDERPKQFIDVLGVGRSLLQLTMDRFEGVIEKDNPKIYQLCDYQNFKEKGYRKAVIKNYVLIYRIDEETNTVYILHFVYGRQDYYSII